MTMQIEIGGHITFGQGERGQIVGLPQVSGVPGLEVKRGPKTLFFRQARVLQWIESGRFSYEPPERTDE